jgi:hypothetical protein
MSSALERIEKAIEALDMKVSEALSLKHKGAVCSFCGKHNTEVKKVVTGPGIAICDECICVCCDILCDHGDIRRVDKVTKYEISLKEGTPKT